MKVKVCEENSALIGGALEFVQYGCSTRIVTPEDVLSSARCLTERLNIPKTCMRGISVDIDLFAGLDTNQDIWTQPPAVRRSTQFTLTYCPTGWYLTDVRRRVPKTHIYSVHLTENAKRAITQYHYRFMD